MFKKLFFYCLFFLFFTSQQALAYSNDWFGQVSSFFGAPSSKLSDLLKSANFGTPQAKKIILKKIVQKKAEIAKKIIQNSHTATTTSILRGANPGFGTGSNTNQQPQTPAQSPALSQSPSQASQQQPNSQSSSQPTSQSGNQQPSSDSNSPGSAGSEKSAGKTSGNTGAVGQCRATSFAHATLRERCVADKNDQQNGAKSASGQYLSKVGTKAIPAVALPKAGSFGDAVEVKDLSTGKCKAFPLLDRGPGPGPISKGVCIDLTGSAVDILKGRQPCDTVGGLGEGQEGIDKVQFALVPGDKIQPGETKECSHLGK